MSKQGDNSSHVHLCLQRVCHLLCCEVGPPSGYTELRFGRQHSGGIVRPPGDQPLSPYMDLQFQQTRLAVKWRACSPYVF